MPANSGINKSSSDIIRLTQSDTDLTKKAKVGVIWSKRSQTTETDQNFIDINKKQTMSMWMFFGGKYSSGGDDTGDGMAFVIQNVGENAFTTVPSSGFVGESLGVWGSETSASDASSTLAIRAIQNSWALEFDTYPNAPEKGGIGTNFDNQKAIGFVINHIADNYPGEPSTYLTGTYPGLIMDHLHPITKVNSAKFPNNFLTDDRWHHVTMTWTPNASDSTKATVNMKFNDKDIDGTLRTPDIERDYPIDLTKFNLSKGTTKLYWGFTGSTGNSQENNLINFESIPAIVEADAATSMYDITSQREISDATTTDPNKNVVYDGDQVNINYNLNYLSGSRSWSNIVGDMKLPTNINYTQGVITYTDTSGNKKTETISELSGMTNNEVKHKLAESLWKNGYKSAEITFTGTVVGSNTSDITVPAQHASFDGDYLQKDVMTQAFVIKYIADINLTAVGNTTINALLNQPVNVQGKVAYSDQTNVDPNNFEIFAKVNNNSSMMISSMTSNPFTLTIPADQLAKGSNTVTLYVVDKTTHKVSNQITFTINVSDSILNLTVSNQMSFGNVQEYPLNKVIGRSSKWTVDVKDTRPVGSKWQLSAQATSLSNNFKGGLVFVNKADSEQSLTDNLTMIATGTKASTDETDVSSSWDSNDGILLRQSGNSSAGFHTGVITWTLVDSTS